MTEEGKSIHIVPGEDVTCWKLAQGSEEEPPEMPPNDHYETKKVRTSFVLLLSLEAVQ